MIISGNYLHNLSFCLGLKLRFSWLHLSAVCDRAIFQDLSSNFFSSPLFNDKIFWWIFWTNMLLNYISPSPSPLSPSHTKNRILCHRMSIPWSLSCANVCPPYLTARAATYLLIPSLSLPCSPITPYSSNFSIVEFPPIILYLSSYPYIVFL